MRVIHCTQKLLKELGVHTLDISAIVPPEVGLGNWYANLLRIKRKKCLLFTNEKTLYSFLLPSVLKADLKNIHSLFLSHLVMNLQYEKIPLSAIQAVQDEYKEIIFAKTISRSVLGSMNDISFHYEYFISSEGGLTRIKLLELNSRINRVPMSAIQYRYPIEVVKEIL